MATEASGSQPVHLARLGSTYTTSSRAFTGSFLLGGVVSYNLERCGHGPSSRMGPRCRIGTRASYRLRDATSTLRL
ncbi:hypothetical protein BHM03_00050977 [Ensete ventricosum]|nr:hypothetical protein BHM03_00050977 [Ensete ventricosum]